MSNKASCILCGAPWTEERNGRDFYACGTRCHTCGAPWTGEARLQRQAALEAESGVGRLIRITPEGITNVRVNPCGLASWKSKHLGPFRIYLNGKLVGVTWEKSFRTPLSIHCCVTSLLGPEGLPDGDRIEVWREDE